MPGILNNRRKLYFAVDMAAAGSTRRVFPITAGRAGFATGDLYGGLIDAVPALTRSSFDGTKRKNMIAAWFVPATQGAGSQIPSVLTNSNNAVAVDFVAWTAAGRTAVAGMGYTGASGALLGGGTLPGGAQVITGTPIAALLTRHMAVRVRRALTGTAGNIKGMLYVERKHDIEI